jgi:hypothetical protein
MLRRARELALQKQASISSASSSTGLASLPVAATAAPQDPAAPSGIDDDLGPSGWGDCDVAGAEDDGLESRSPSVSPCRSSGDDVPAAKRRCFTLARHLSEPVSQFLHQCPWPSLRWWVDPIVNAVSDIIDERLRSGGLLRPMHWPLSYCSGMFSEAFAITALGIPCAGRTVCAEVRRVTEYGSQNTFC